MGQSGDVKVTHYGEHEVNIVEQGVDAIAEVLNGTDDAAKESLLFCLDRYLDPYFGYNLPYADKICELLQYVVINPNSRDNKDEALRLLSLYLYPPFAIIEANLDKIEEDLVPDVQEIMNPD